MELDARLTFEGFVTGPSNRLAAAAARRVADAPAAAYNPLFIHAASGLGKTHLLMAIGTAVRRAKPGLPIIYASIEPADGEDGGGDALRERLQSARVLLLDDVQLLAERPALQEDLLAVWDVVAAKGGQIVLAADRPPNEIEGLERRLLSRFSGGLVADIMPPTFDERVLIVQRKASEGAHRLAAGVPEILAEIAFGNVREVHGALNRVIAVQEVEQRLIAAAEIPSLLGRGGDDVRGAEFVSFRSDIVGAVDELVARHAPDQLLAEAILRFEGEGYRTTRLEAALTRGLTPESAEQLIAAFEADVQRLEAASTAIRSLERTAPELARVDVLLDPDRVADAEVLVDRVRERIEGGGPASANGNGTAAARKTVHAPVRARPGDVRDTWFLSPEKVLWSWPYIEDWIVGEPD